MSAFLLPLSRAWPPGLVVASVFFLLYSRTQRKSAARHAGRRPLGGRGARRRGRPARAPEARAAIVLEGKMETLRLREDLEREASKRREEWERFERRAEERDRALERKLEEVQKQERGFTATGVGADRAGGRDSRRRGPRSSG